MRSTYLSFLIIIIAALVYTGCESMTGTEGSLDQESAVLSESIDITANASTVAWYQGFEVDTDGWFSPTRVASGTNGITSSVGNWHAEAGGDFTRWGGYNSSLLTSNDYKTSLDIYLDVDGGNANDTRFDFTSAVYKPDATHRRDFVFNCGFYDDTGTPGSGDRFICSASNNALRANAYPKNPGKDPIVVTDSDGWFTFEHHFYDDGSGVLAVDLSIYDASGNLVNTWTLNDATDIIGDTVGGNGYGWFALQEFNLLAIDNTFRSDVINAPETKNDCKKGGWEEYGFKNQGQCVRYVNTGKDSRE